MRDVHDRHYDEEPRDGDDDLEQIRYSLTALGEAQLEERRGKPFRGFGPCSTPAWQAAS